jgi:hypothetical protein
VFILTRAESPYYSTVLSLFIVRAFSPLVRRGHFSLGDAALAQGWYKFAPLALNCGFQVEQKQDVPWILLCPFRARGKTTESRGDAALCPGLSYLYPLQGCISGGGNVP